MKGFKELSFNGVIFQDPTLKAQWDGKLDEDSGGFDTELMVNL